MRPKAWLIKLLKTIGVDMRQAIMGMIVGAVILMYGGILALSKTVLNFSTQILNKPTPVWVTALLVLLCGLYIFLNSAKRPTSSKIALTSNKPTPVIKYFTIGKHKWKTEIYPNGYYTVDETPLCAVHDLPFIYKNRFYGCPETQGCNGSFYAGDERYTLIQTAKSYIDKKVRDRDY